MNKTRISGVEALDSLTNIFESTNRVGRREASDKAYHIIMKCMRKHDNGFIIDNRDGSTVEVVFREDSFFDLTHTHKKKGA